MMENRLHENLEALDLDAMNSLIFGTSKDETPESVIPFTELELELIHAIQADPRGSWASIGAGLGVNATTAARRWQEISSSGRAWVLGYSIEVVPVVAYLWLGCDPKLIDRIGARLCLERHVYLIERVDGQYDYFLGVSATTAAGLDRLIAEVAGIPGVREVSTNLCLRVLHDGSSWVPGILANRAPARIAEVLERTTPTPTRASATELAIVSALGGDGRATFGAIATRIGMTESTVRRHLHRLIDANQVRLRCDISQQAAGWPISMVLIAEVDGDAVGFGQAVAGWAATRLISVTSGPGRLTMLFWLRSPADGYLLQERLRQQGQTIQIVAAAIGLRPLKRMGWLFGPSGATSGYVPMGIYSGR